MKVASNLLALTRALAIKKISQRVYVQRGRNCVIEKDVTIGTFLTIEDDVRIMKGCTIIGGPVFIGRGTSLAPNGFVVGPLIIGRYCAIAGSSAFVGISHRMNMVAVQVRVYRETIGVPLDGMEATVVAEVGSDVWTGRGVTVLPGVRIGHGAVIGAGSTVTKDVPPYSITAGNPAKHIRYRFSPEIIEILLGLKWWDWPIERIARNKAFFTKDLNTVEDLGSIVVD